MSNETPPRPHISSLEARTLEYVGQGWRVKDRGDGWVVVQQRVNHLLHAILSALTVISVAGWITAALSRKMLELREQPDGSIVERRI